MVVFGQIRCICGCIRVIWFYWGKVVVFGQSGCIREKVFSNRAKWLYSGKAVVFW